MLVCNVLKNSSCKNSLHITGMLMDFSNINIYITGISKGLAESKSTVGNLKFKTTQKLTQDHGKTNGKDRKMRTREELLQGNQY